MFVYFKYGLKLRDGKRQKKYPQTFPCIIIHRIVLFYLFMGYWLIIIIIYLFQREKEGSSYANSE
jgi:hypothetical protein